MPFNLPEQLSLNATVIVVAIATLLAALVTALFFVLRHQKQQRLQVLQQAELERLNQALQASQEQHQASQQAQQQSQHSAQQAQQELAALKARLDSERQAADEKLALLEQAREQLKAQFENTAQAIFDKKTQQFSERSTEQIGQILSPLTSQLKGFQETVEKKFVTEGKERAGLQAEIKQLHSLNQRLTDEAKNLTTALSGQNKAQGNWGEMVLKKVLEASGLQEGREYKEQVSVTQDGKRLQPDVVVYLPDNRVVVIDSKVSLTAYQAYCAAETDTDRQRHLKAHLDSLRAHLKGLSNKSYQDAFGSQSLDFVFMFVPIEAAYLDALQHEAGLFEEAMKMNIGLISPSSLLTNLRTVANLWRYENQNKNALKIAETAGKLYDKLSDGLDAFKDVEHRLNQASKSWDTAWSRLADGRGNVIRTAEQIRELGVKTKKQIEHEHNEQAALTAKAKPAEDSSS
mgnify:CR=1 FL=1